jgi:DNA repair exonuclease SbcCD nuclease subunit
MSDDDNDNDYFEMRSFVGIGDLHLDGRLQKYLPTDLNEFIIGEVRLILRKVLKKGIKLCVFYGDIGDKPLLSYGAHKLIIDLIREFPMIRMLFLKGNHDHLNDAVSGLDLLVHMKFPNAKFVTHTPKTFFANTDYPLILHPWPHYKEVERGNACNVLHIETRGSLMDSGRVSSTQNEIDPKCFWVAGHLHTNHLNYSGTVYQTSFGEKPEKFFHIVDRVSKKITSVPHRPRYRLENVVIESLADLETKIPKDPETLVKLFIKSQVLITEGTLDKYTNVVKHNSFKTKQELQALVMEDFVIDDISGSANFDVDMALSDWMTSEKVSPALMKRALKLNRQMLRRETATATPQ